MTNNQNDPEEIKIALNLVKNIKENNILFRGFSSIERILNIYFSQNNRNKNEEKQIINLIFQCIDTFGLNAASLFKHLKKSEEKNNIIKRFHEKYNEKYSFNMINSFIFERPFDSIKENDESKKIIFLTISLIFSFIILLIVFLQNNEYKKYIRSCEENNKKCQEKVIFLAQKLGQQNSYSEEKNKNNQLPEDQTKDRMKIFLVLILSLIEMVALLTINLPIEFIFVYGFLTLIVYVLFFFFAPGNFVYSLFVTIPSLMKLAFLLDILMDNPQYQIFFVGVHKKPNLSFLIVSLVMIFNYFNYIS